MKTRLLILILSISTLGIAQKKERPNIIVFLIDDMGIMDNSVPFCDSAMPLNKRFHTPYMEQMAKHGMKFTNAYAQPVCTPSRTSMMTGMNAARSHITNWTSPIKNNNSEAQDDQFFSLDWNMNGLSPVAGVEHTLSAVSFPQLLKHAGYYTIHVGKAHWGAMGTMGANPYNLGFMVNIGGHAGGHPQSYLSEEGFGNLNAKVQQQAVPDLQEYYNTGTFLTEALTREAIKAMEVPITRKEPFFLNMAHYAVHTPIMPDPRFVQKYIDAGLSKQEAAYASLVEGMDKSLGDIMAFLARKKADRNTVIIFMSDNGGFDRRDGNINTHNYPFRSGKGSVYEGGIREPMLVKWPAVIKPGSVNRNDIIIEDFFPTILDMAGIKKQNLIQKTDGISFLPILQNPSLRLPERPLVFHYPHKWTHVKEEKLLGINYYSALKLNNWKLVYRMRTGELELYNLDTDISEQHDLAGTEKNKTKELAVLLGKILKERKAQMPVSKTNNTRVAYPDDLF